MSSAATAVLAARQPRTLPTAAPTSVSTTGESSDNGGMIMAVVFCVVGAIVVLRMVLWYRRLRAQEAQQAELERELATLVQEQSALQLQVTGLKDDFISTLPTREFHSNDMPAEDAKFVTFVL
jgi:cell division protein FtsB